MLKIPWLKYKHAIILWLANGEPYTLNTSMKLPAQAITVQHVKMIGDPSKNVPFLTIGDPGPYPESLVAIGAK